jgi:alkylation response protein AidB-like acyl-CoA dehydrogenase
MTAMALPPRQSERLFHDLLLPEETLKVRQQAREVAEREVFPHAGEIGAREEAVEHFPWAPFRALGAAGLFAVPFDAGYGAGLAYRAAATATVIEELAYVSSSVAAIYDVHCILAGNALAFGSSALKDRWLRPLVTGDVVGAFATTEPGASSDLSVDALQTEAERTADGWVVTGRKRFITNSPVADFVVVLCRTGQRMTLLLVPLKDTPGVRIGPPDKKLGNRGQLTADVYFDGVEVPDDYVVGDVGQGLRIALSTLTYGRIGIGAAGVGLAQAAFDIAADHVARRQVFGKRLGEFQHWQFKLAERATEIENARNLYQKAALRLDAGVAFPEPEAAMAKHYGTSLAVDMARDAIQALGGYGFLRELGDDGTQFRAEEIYRDSKIGEIYEGANEIQKWVIARTILGRDITG